MPDGYTGQWVTFARPNGRWSLYHKITGLVVGASSPVGLASTGDDSGRYWIAVCGSAYPCDLAARADSNPPRAMTCLDCHLGRVSDGPISMSIGVHFPKLGTGELKRLENE